MISDETIANTVKNALAADPRVGSMDITVHSSHGRVQLQGDIASVSQKIAAEEIARSIPGVTAVHNHLRVADLTAAAPDREER